MKKLTTMGGASLAESSPTPVGESRSRSETHSQTQATISSETVTISRSGSTAGFLERNFAQGNVRGTQVTHGRTGLGRPRELFRRLIQTIASSNLSAQQAQALAKSIETLLEDALVVQYIMRSSSKEWRENLNSSATAHDTKPLSEDDRKAIDQFLADIVATEEKKLSAEDKRKRIRARLERFNRRAQLQARQGASPQTLLPEEEKRAIENQPYGKQTRAAEMSEKIQRSIESGELPGEFIFRELIEPSGQTLRFIAKKIDVHHMSLSHLKAGRMSLSGDMAAKLSHHFRTHSTLKHTYSTQELLSLQSAIDAKKADQSLQKQLASPPEKKDPTPA